MGSNPQKSVVRIGHLLTSLWPGGIEQFVLSLAKGLPKDRFETKVYSWMGDDPWRDEFTSNGIEVFATQGPNRCKSPRDLAKISKAWWQLQARLRRDRIDILHTHDFFPALVGRTASHLAGVPARVTTLHNLYEWWPKWAFSANRILARGTGSITCVSESVRQFMIDHERLPADRYRTILNGVDERRFHPDSGIRTQERQALGIGSDEILVGSVGSITTRKAQWILAKAVAPLIHEGIPLQVRIWGANGDNPQHAEKELRDLVASLGIEERFKLMAPRKDIQRVYNAMDFHCMTSVAEGLSLASVEAMMCGVVPIYSDIGPFREVVDDRVTGRLFQSGNPGDLERVLRQVLGEAGLRERMADSIRGESMKRFGLSRMVGEYAGIYEAVLK